MRYVLTDSCGAGSEKEPGACYTTPTHLTFETRIKKELCIFLRIHRPLKIMSDQLAPVFAFVKSTLPMGQVIRLGHFSSGIGNRSAPIREVRKIFRSFGTVQ